MIDVVLGAGGALGWIFHLGVVRVLRAEGVEPRTVIGTSAGSAIAASWRSGATEEAMLEAVVRGPSEAQQAEIRARLSEPRRFGGRIPADPLALRHLVGSLRLGALAGLLPEGRVPTAQLRRFPVDDRWPDGLRIVTVDLAAGRRVVLDGSDPSFGPHEAIEASSAIPGVFEAPVIDGRRYVDGAVWSPTNADLLADVVAPGDRTIVSSPMTGVGGGPVRWRARRQLPAELEQATEAGAEPLVVEPDEAFAAAVERFPRGDVVGARRLTDLAAELVAPAVGRFVNGHSRIRD